MSSKDRDRVRQTGRLVFEAILDLAERFKPIDVRLPRIGSASPEDAARIARADLGFSPDVPVTGLVKRLERNGVIVASIPHEIEEHDAFSAWADTEPKTPVIVMTAGKPGDRQRWSVAHELGHLVLHYTYAKSISDLEDEADRFASEFLLPSETLRKDFITPLTLTTLADLKSRWGVSMQALIMRAFQLDVITDGQRRYLFRQMSARGWMRTEPVPIPVEKPRLLRKLAESVFGPNVQAKDLVEPLGIPITIMAPIFAAYSSSAELKQASEPLDHTTPRTGGRLLQMMPRGK